MGFGGNAQCREVRKSIERCIFGLFMGLVQPNPITIALALLWFNIIFWGRDMDWTRQHHRMVNGLCSCKAKQIIVWTCSCRIATLIKAPNPKMLQGAKQLQQLCSITSLLFHAILHLIGIHVYWFHG